jgi:hypothetical protein
MGNMKLPLSDIIYIFVFQTERTKNASSFISIPQMKFQGSPAAQ